MSRSNRAPYSHPVQGRPSYQPSQSRPTFQKNTYDKRDRSTSSSTLNRGTNFPGSTPNPNPSPNMNTYKSTLNPSSASFQPDSNQLSNHHYNHVPNFTSSNSNTITSSAKAFVPSSAWSATQSDSKTFSPFIAANATPFTPNAPSFTPNSSSFNNYNTSSPAYFDNSSSYDNEQQFSSQTKNEMKPIVNSIYDGTPIITSTTDEQRGKTSSDLNVYYHLMNIDQWPIVHLEDELILKTLEKNNTTSNSNATSSYPYNQANTPSKSNSLPKNAKSKNRFASPSTTNSSIRLPDGFFKFQPSSTSLIHSSVYQPSIITENYLRHAFTNSDIIPKKPLITTPSNQYVVGSWDSPSNGGLGNWDQKDDVSNPSNEINNGLYLTIPNSNSNTLYNVNTSSQSYSKTDVPSYNSLYSESNSYHFPNASISSPSFEYYTSNALSQLDNKNKPKLKTDNPQSENSEIDDVVSFISNHEQLPLEDSINDSAIPNASSTNSTFSSSSIHSKSGSSFPEASESLNEDFVNTFFLKLPSQPRIDTLKLPFNPPVENALITPTVYLAYENFKPISLRLFGGHNVCPSAPTTPALTHIKDRDKDKEKEKDVLLSSGLQPLTQQVKWVNQYNSEISLNSLGETKLVDIIWSKGIQRKCYICSNLATTQCLTSAKARLPLPQTLFCSYTCLRKNWDKNSVRLTNLLNTVELPYAGSVTVNEFKPYVSCADRPKEPNSLNPHSGNLVDLGADNGFSSFESDIKPNTDSEVSSSSLKSKDESPDDNDDCDSESLYSLFKQDPNVITCYLSRHSDKVLHQNVDVADIYMKDDSSTNKTATKKKLSSTKAVSSGEWFHDEDLHFAMRLEFEETKHSHIQKLYNTSHNQVFNDNLTQRLKDKPNTRSNTNSRTSNSNSSPQPVYVPGTGLLPYTPSTKSETVALSSSTRVENSLMDAFLYPFSWYRHEALCCKFPPPLEDSFTVIGTGHHFTPSKNDVYSCIKVDVAPACVVDYNTILANTSSPQIPNTPTVPIAGKSFKLTKKTVNPSQKYIDPSVVQRWVSLITNPVLPAPLPLVSRKKLNLNIHGPNHKSSYVNGFKVMHYNILADYLALQNLYDYCPAWALQWSYRKKLVFQEIEANDADIVCLQEVSKVQIEDFAVHMHTLGYSYKFLLKTRESEFVDGSATFYKRNKFVLLSSQEIKFNDITQQYLRNTPFSNYLYRLLRGNVCLAVELEYIGGRSNYSRTLCVANTHIFWDPTFPDVKLFQSWMLMCKLSQFYSHLPLIICGDFNSTPDSTVYEFITKQSISPIHKQQLDEFKYLPNFNDLKHPFNFVSAYAEIFSEYYNNNNYNSTYGVMDEPKYTNYTRHFKGTLDYIFYTKETNLVCVEVQEVESEDLLSEFTALPSPRRPSDHIPLVASFEWF